MARGRIQNPDRYKTQQRIKALDGDSQSLEDKGMSWTSLDVAFNCRTTSQMKSDMDEVSLKT